MLLKLFKYDFKNVAKIGLPISLVMLLTSGLAAVLWWFISIAFETENEMLADTIMVVSLFMMFTWVIALVVYSIGIKFLVVYRYYTHFFTDQGYLTFTLPCKTSSHFKSKILNGLLWDLISSVVVVCCVGIVLLALPSDINFGERIWDAFSLYTMFDNNMLMTPEIQVIQKVIELVFTSISELMILYIAVTIGAMVANRHKILASIGFYLAISWTFSLIETLATIIPKFTMLANYDYYMFEAYNPGITSDWFEQYQRMYNTAGWITTGITLGLHLTAIVVFYLLNRRFLNKKLNLA